MYIEPVGSVAPKVNVADKVSISSIRQSHVTNILCPAQGYPMPAFRYFNLIIMKTVHEFVIISQCYNILSPHNIRESIYLLSKFTLFQHFNLYRIYLQVEMIIRY